MFDFKKCYDLEIRVRGHSRSSELARIDPPPMTSYERYIATYVTSSLSRTVSEINSDMSLAVFAVDFSQKLKNRNFPAPMLFNAGGVPLGIGYRHNG